ncbi:MAG: hypothetical protein A2694_02555 [Candidatus Blackburnbacteria bacterium RIFCSPHIGHO2_01_FULL_40_17]|uniref:Fibronectin type-III domain-containing protein n=1 Tax=Candidatus Blackburnbacteria bacterium RIFCSPLOWO2_01_FULL_40_20 TaxID=1797519 RepID=A0A1G1VCR5_9BACT|nr:MAG: hypothetical protein UT38_C0010G0017 [Microgenomates group bacterium GW2011_GWA2_39_19]OGY06974.1 MAG: hypothetical protein A2694_02555 [Candidatus Blackburnbacteria bacterium RIFCSPHIGHO2_01_FULL_40_17]OGY13230.1 MAG: hypothetical protein A3A77_01505 [Candidatus Blackburnbacteria bacterium RIFCSPLOWO2_01_FULL_40_20]HBL52386.1 hypothetical protein [Candidatus Blackburnbacteria bacterium]
MKKMNLKSLIPLTILVVGVVVGIVLVSNQQKTRSKADIESVPKDVRITNLSDNSFSVSWTTLDKADVGYVSYGENESLGSMVGDDRDPTSSTTDVGTTLGARQRFTHHVTIKNLDPAKTYFFNIGSGAKLYANNGVPYQATTAPTTNDTPPLPESAFGRVLVSGNTIPSDALVYLNVEGSTPLSSYIRENGNWLITLNNARTEDLFSYINPQGKQIDLFVQGGNNGSKSVKATGSYSPVRNIVLGSTEDSLFTTSTQQISKKANDDSILVQIQKFIQELISPKK